MEYGEKLELMRSEVRRLLREYKDYEFGFDEMATGVYLDPRLDLMAQVNVFAQVVKEIDNDDEVSRYTRDGGDWTFVETYGVDMGDNHGN